MLFIEPNPVFRASERHSGNDLRFRMGGDLGFVVCAPCSPGGPNQLHTCCWGPMFGPELRGHLER